MAGTASAAADFRLRPRLRGTLGERSLTRQASSTAQAEAIAHHRKSILGHMLFR